LQTARKHYPQIIRVTLTGQPDKDVYCDVMTISHYFLWKPAKLEDLKILFDSIQNQDNALHDKTMIRLIGGITALPSLPPLFEYLFAQCSKKERGTFRLDELWQHSLCTATLAKAIAEIGNGNAAIGNSAYLAGLLDEIGKLIHIMHLPEIYAEILQEVHQQGKSQVQIESNRLGTNHAIIGGYLTSLWGLPYTITEAVSLHLYRRACRPGFATPGPSGDDPAPVTAGLILFGDCCRLALF
jgi:hypothetical protein